MRNNLEHTYLKICKIISEQSDERLNDTNPNYKGPKQITCTITDPKELAGINEMSYEDFYQDLQNMVKALKAKRVQVLGSENGGQWGKFVKLGFSGTSKDIATFLKTPTIGVNLDPDVASIIYDLSEGNKFPADVDEDPIGILNECPSVRIVDIDDQDYYNDISANSSNVEDYFLSEEYLNEAKEYLGDADNDTDI